MLVLKVNIRILKIGGFTSCIFYVITVVISSYLMDYAKCYRLKGLLHGRVSSSRIHDVEQDSQQNLSESYYTEYRLVEQYTQRALENAKIP